MNTKEKTSQYGALLTANGFKVTPGRLGILGVLSAFHRPLSAEEICKKVKPAVLDRATVYRTLSSFVEAGLVKKVHLTAGMEHFEMNDSHHHHMVCTDCGVIEDFDVCGIDATIGRLLKKSRFRSIATHSLELFGTCKKCAAV